VSDAGTENAMNGNLGKFVRLCMMTAAGGVLLAGTIVTRGPSFEAGFDASSSCPHAHAHVLRLGVLRVVLPL
jgi:hypothetical protein